MSAKTKVTKTKTALKQETYNLSDLKYDLHCGFVELGRLGLGLIVASTIGSSNSTFTTIALSLSSSLLIYLRSVSSRTFFRLALMVLDFGRVMNLT